MLAQIDGEGLDGVAGAGEVPEHEAEAEGVDLPGGEDATEEGPVELGGGFTAFGFDSFAGAVLLPVAEPEGFGLVRCVGNDELERS